MTANGFGTSLGGDGKVLLDGEYTFLDNWVISRSDGKIAVISNRTVC